MQYRSNLDLNRNQIQNIVIDSRASDPTTPAPVDGQIYYNTTDKVLKYYNSTTSTWVVILGGVAQLLSWINGGSAIITSQVGNQVVIDFNPENVGTAGSRGTISVVSDKAGVDLSITDGTKAMPGGTTLNAIPKPTADVDMNNHKIIGVSAPTIDTDAATKGYVDAIVNGLDWKSVKAATTANITLSGEQTIDGVALSVGDRVLVKNQTTQSTNGIYIVATSSWARSTNADSWAELVSAAVIVEQGTENGDTAWLCTVDEGGTLGTTPITWTYFPGAGSILGGAGLTRTGNTLDVNVDNQSIEIASDNLQVKLDTAGAITKSASGVKVNLDTQSMQISTNQLGAKLNTAGAVQKDASGLKVGVDNSTIQITTNKLNVKDGGITSDKLAVGAVDLTTTKVTGVLPIAKGGTGANSAAGARTNLGTTGKYVAIIGNGSATSIAVPHNLGVRQVLAKVFLAASPYTEVMCDIENTSTTTTTFKFSQPPANNELEVVITG